jgi:SH3-like domain-containing protein
MSSRIRDANGNWTWSEKEKANKRRRQNAKNALRPPRHRWKGILEPGEYAKIYAKLYAEQEGKCRICKRWFEAMHLDHCHKTLKIRGLLCVGCNTKLGWFEKWEANVYEYLD